MTDPREILARIRAQADAATEGPWELLGDGEYVSGPGILVAPDDGGVTSADAEFIAAARTTVPALLDALEKVLELHQPVTDGMGFTEHGYGGISPACGACGTSDEYAVPYPCPTVTAITTALEATK
mgnify:FL=1